MALEIRGQFSQNAWDSENAFYWFSHPTRISKLLAHFEIYKQILDVPGDVIEFGVYKATSLVRLATFRKILENDFARRVVGFDAFGKFPQNESNAPSDPAFIAKFEKEGGDGLSVIEVQKVIDFKNFENIELISGDVFETLPKWISANSHSRIAFLHLDLDVYAPTKYVLDELWDRVVTGGIVVFDDYNSVEGETLAVDEFLEAKGLKLAKNHFYNVPSFLVKV